MRAAPDLIVTDLKMPAGGFEYVHRLRTSAPTLSDYRDDGVRRCADQKRSNEERGDRLFRQAGSPLGTEGDGEAVAEAARSTGRLAHALNARVVRVSQGQSPAGEGCFQSMRRVQIGAS